MSAEPSVRTEKSARDKAKRGDYVQDEKPPDLTETDCACGCGKKLPRLAVVHGDIYATTACCKKAHDVRFDEKHEALNPAGRRRTLQHRYPRCKCANCRAGEAKRRAERKKDQLLRGDFKHGTATGYGIGCRCELCRKADATRKAEMRKARRGSGS